jgi:hypothetical protein
VQDPTHGRARVFGWDMQPDGSWTKTELPCGHNKTGVWSALLALSRRVLTDNTIRQR